MDISGLLLMPSNKNGNAIKNILSIVFNKCSIEYNNLPFIDKITFLETDDLKEIQLDGETYSAHIFYEKVLTALNLNEIELRRKKFIITLLIYQIQLYPLFTKLEKII